MKLRCSISSNVNPVPTHPVPTHVEVNQSLSIRLQQIGLTLKNFRGLHIFLHFMKRKPTFNLVLLFLSPTVGVQIDYKRNNVLCLEAVVPKSSVKQVFLKI